jgi:anti-anti-sigma factor
MPEPNYHHLDCSAVVLTITEAQLQGDPVADGLRADLLAALERSGARHIVLDFQHVTYVSSVAFRPLLSLYRKIKENGGRLVLCGMKDRVSEVFHVTRLVRVSGTVAAPFELQSDVPAAIESLYHRTSGHQS